jgi:hypothetical protein
MTSSYTERKREREKERKRERESQLGRERLKGKMAKCSIRRSTQKQQTTSGELLQDDSARRIAPESSAEDREQQDLLFGDGGRDKENKSEVGGGCATESLCTVVKASLGQDKRRLEPHARTKEDKRRKEMGERSC